MHYLQWCTYSSIITNTGKLGISQNDHVVVYDTAGVFSACRVYWTFKVQSYIYINAHLSYQNQPTHQKAFGHDSISVLNGGLPAWEKADGPVETGPPEPVKPQVYKVSRVNKDIVRNYETVLANARDIQQGKQGAQVLDARPYARFTGEAPEPRIGLSSGHMPGSISVAFNEVVESGEMLDDDKLRKVFESKGVDVDKEIITSCGNSIILFHSCACVYSFYHFYQQEAVLLRPSCIWLWRESVLANWLSMMAAGPSMLQRMMH